MAYDKDQVQAVADAVYDVVQAVKDGLDVSDMTAGMALMTAFMAAADEFKNDTDAAGLHMGARLMDRFGDSRVDAPASE